MVRYVCCLLFSIVFGCQVFGQCGTETVSVVGGGYCANQYAEFQILPATAPGTQYHWFSGTNTGIAIDYGYGSSFVSPVTYPSGSGTVNFYYRKEILASGGPSLGVSTGTSTYSNNGLAQTITYTSPTSFLLQYLTVGVYLYGSGTYSLAVSVNGNTSNWYTFTLSDVVPFANQLYFVRIPVNLVAPAGSNVPVSLVTTGVPSGSSSIGAVFWEQSSPFASSYSISPSITLNYGAAVQSFWGNTWLPGFFTWEVTSYCPLVTASATETSVGCCVPISSSPTMTSSVGNLVASPFTPAGTINASGLSSSLYYQWYKDGIAIATASGVGVTSLSINTSGKYTVRVVTSAGFVTRKSCYNETTLWLQERELFAVVTSTSACWGDPISLYASGATSTVNWSSSSGNAVVSCSSCVSTFANTSTLGVYTFTVTGKVPSGNQIINGDFESGVSINSTYIYEDPTTAYSNSLYPGQGATCSTTGRKFLSLGSQNRYTINNYVFHPDTWCPGYVYCNNDHTTGNGKFMYMDGSSASGAPANRYIWSQTVNVTAGSTYEFSGWFMDIDPFVSNAKAQVMVYLNDQPILANALTVSGATCAWQKATYAYTASVTGNVTLKISEVTGVVNGNDFAMDDIAFGEPSNQTSLATVTVTDCYFINGSASGCVGDSVALSALTNGTFAGWTRVGGSMTGIRMPSLSTTTAFSGAGNSVFIAKANFPFGITKTATITGLVCALPIEVINFDVENGTSSVGINWTLAATKHIVYVSVEKSFDGIYFHSIQKRGVLSNTYDYSYQDTDLAEGRIYYRLVLVYGDGSAQTTPIKSVDRYKPVRWHIFPNPSPGEFQLKIISEGQDELAHMIVRSVTGAIVFEKDITLTNENVWLMKLASGVYVAELVVGDTYLYEKLVVY